MIATGRQEADESITVCGRRGLGLLVMFLPDGMELAHHGIVCKYPEGYTLGQSFTVAVSRPNKELTAMQESRRVRERV